MRLPYNERAHSKLQRPPPTAFQCSKHCRPKSNPPAAACRLAGRAWGWKAPRPPLPQPQGPRWCLHSAQAGPVQGREGLKRKLHTRLRSCNKIAALAQEGAPCCAARNPPPAPAATGEAGLLSPLQLAPALKEQLQTHHGQAATMPPKASRAHRQPPPYLPARAALRACPHLGSAVGRAWAAAVRAPAEGGGRGGYKACT